MYLYECDIKCRYPDHTLVQTIDGGDAVWTLMDASGDIVLIKRGPIEDDVADNNRILKGMRENLGIDSSVLPCVSDAESASVSMCRGQQVLNENDDIKTHDGDSWVA